MSQRDFLRVAGTCATGTLLGSLSFSLEARAVERTSPWFKTRGAVLVVRDMETYDWPKLAHEAGLTTLATHIRPREVAAFLKSGPGQRFRDGCTKYQLQLEHELHAL